MKSINYILLFLLLFISCHTAALAQTRVDPEILREVRSIKAIDNHSHVLQVVGPGETDDEGDAMPCGELNFVSPPPMRLRFDNPIYIGAWRELYGYRFDDMKEDHVKDLLAVKSRIKSQQGDNYPSWILDKLGIEVMLANRVSMGRGLNSHRFRWVGYGDPLLLPFSTVLSRKKNPDLQVFLGREEWLFKKFMGRLGVDRLPVSFDQYLKGIVTPSLMWQKDQGAVAIKFVAAYYRSLKFDSPTKAEAAAVYSKYARGGEPSPDESKKFQDFVFRYMIREIGRLGMLVHIHTGGGCGHYFNLSGSNPVLLESVINDPATRDTKIVLIHGGYPYTNETAFLLEKPGVYSDFSAQTFLLSPSSLSKVLKSWLEYEPEKVLFGTDASAGPPEVDWEESAWMTTNVAREALALALTELVDAKEITRARAFELARMVLRDNAAKLYGIKK